MCITWRVRSGRGSSVRVPAMLLRNSDVMTERRPSRDLAALIVVIVALLMSSFGLLLPSHDYTGIDGLDGMVSRDSRLASTLFASFTLAVAAMPLLARPVRWVRIAATFVLALALYNFVNCASYYLWRSDLVL